MSGKIETVNAKTPKDKPDRDSITGRAGEFVDEFIENVEGSGIFRVMGVQEDSTFLVYGPAGTGKSLAVNVINNELNPDFKVIETVRNERTTRLPLNWEFMTFPYSIGKYGTAYINMGAKNLQTFFDTAYNYANEGKNVLLSFDECENLLIDRQGGAKTHGEDKKVLETLMTNMQKAHDKEGIYMMFMSNMPEICDNASLRTGRIDRKYEIPLPNEEERASMFETAADKISEYAGYQIVRGVNYEELAEMTEGLSYSDIDNVVQRAVKSRAREIYENTSDRIITAGWIKQGRIEKAIKQHQEENSLEEKIGYGPK